MSFSKLLPALCLLLASLAAGAAERINLNTADAATLAAGIDGIGPAKAAAIVAWRDEHGPFKTVDDLLLVRGIGQATLDSNRERLTASTP
ncbi:MAG: helix-hairpin-helix domain-containing protein [Gammaproteobacteria bacterium]